MSWILVFILYIMGGIQTYRFDRSFYDARMNIYEYLFYILWPLEIFFSVIFYFFPHLL